VSWAEHYEDAQKGGGGILADIESGVEKYDPAYQAIKAYDNEYHAEQDGCSLATVFGFAAKAVVADVETGTSLDGEGEVADAVDGAVDAGDAGNGARYIFRSGSQSKNALTDPAGVSFRDSVSSSADGSQTFRPGSKVFAVDTEMLPDGSVEYDGVPDGHVTVNATPAEIQGAVVRSFPDNPFEGLSQMQDGSWRLPNK
jgi:hypothetical protein